MKLLNLSLNVGYVCCASSGTITKQLLVCNHYIDESDGRYPM